MKIRYVGITTVLALVSTLSFAASETFIDLDKNEDGKISRVEAASSSQLLARFDELDTNKDGVLSESEFAKYSDE
ncbi:crotonobetainyl-CoA--carnitine CoA-transferase (plasmid) [Pseudoalteromonas sp. T1lg65]|uniref:crotonobetainyl-CoA--carnitine CoA-transferase n=1 Tax=Pseudoalteromonas sp. T1lg65 TaxID=2077101 RepID=UPI003F7AE1DB